MEAVIGTVYETMKDVMRGMKPLTELQIPQEIEKIFNFTNNIPNRHYMLLNKELSDYTIFQFENFYNDWGTKKAQLNKDIYECLTNRGKIISINEEDNEIEIWLLINDEAYCYHFFPYDRGVIEIDY